MKACIKARDIAASGEKVIIWTSFLFNIDMIEEQLLRHNVNQNQVLKIDGSVPKDDDDEGLDFTDTDTSPEEKIISMNTTVAFNKWFNKRFPKEPNLTITPLMETYVKTLSNLNKYFY